MNEEIKKEWVKRLRSKEYKQGTCFLHNNGCFCVMGVLADIYRERFNLQWEPKFKDMPGFILKDFTSRGTVENLMMDWVGLPYNAQCILTSRNDHGDTFEELADYIEDSLEGVINNGGL